MHETNFTIGESCGKYRIVSLLGLGGVSEVYKAIHRETKMVVALKALRQFFASNPHVRERMLGEAELLSRLRHPNVVRVEEYGIERGILWMAMEHIHGSTLRSHLRGGDPMDVRRALYYAKGIADGAAAAHAMCVIHRDIKPENVMITTRNKVKLLDMGAAKFQGWNIKRTTRGTLFGTPLYMSPEHIREEAIDERSDVYSLGLILYEMLAGRHPFAEGRCGGLAKHEICELQIHVDPTPLADLMPGFSLELSNFVRRAVAKEPEDRPKSMAEFALDLRAFLVTLGGEPLSVPSLRRVPVSHEPASAAGAASAAGGEESHAEGPPSSGAQPVCAEADEPDIDASTLIFRRPVAAAITRRSELVEEDAETVQIAPHSSGVSPPASLTITAVSASPGVRSLEGSGAAGHGLLFEPHVETTQLSAGGRRRLSSRALWTIVSAGSVAAAMLLAYARVSASAAPNGGQKGEAATFTSTEQAPGSEAALDTSDTSAAEPASAGAATAGSREAAAAPEAEKNTNSVKASTCPALPAKSSPAAPARRHRPYVPRETMAPLPNPYDPPAAKSEPAARSAGMTQVERYSPTDI